MGIEILTRQPIKFYEKQGIKFFEPFNAVDKFKKPVKMFFEESDELATIVAENHQNKQSLYGIQFDIPKREMDGVTLAAEPRREGLGELLNLAALIEFHKNNLNHFKVFSLKESIPFYTRYGFKIDSEDIDYILRGLKMVMKSKSPRLENLRRDADFFYPKIAGTQKSDDPFLKERGCEVISNYLMNISRNNNKFDSSKLDQSSHMKFTDWEFETNRDYLNNLFDKHEINYKI